jgi:light-independent protochlorophyllide reductase subunit B
LILGTQMERHIAKRHAIPCAVISAPVHVQDFPARYAPQMGFEGANVLFDTWVHPLMMGLEEHLLGMFREDFEFHDGAGSSHLGAGKGMAAATQPVQESLVEMAAHADAAPAVHAPAVAPVAPAAPAVDTTPGITLWSKDAEKELGKIPFFVRGKARRNTERFASEMGIQNITVETLYDAKAHFSR